MRQENSEILLKTIAVLSVLLIVDAMGQPYVSRSQILGDKKTTTARILTPCEAKLNKLVQSLLREEKGMGISREKLYELIRGYEYYKDPDAQVVHSIESQRPRDVSQREPIIESDEFDHENQQIVDQRQPQADSVQSIRDQLASLKKQHNRRRQKL